MPRAVLIAVTFALAAPTARADTLAALEAEQEALFDRIAPGVVVISADGTIATGFAVAPGLVLTAAHAVAAARSVTVSLRDGRAVAGTVAEVAPDGLDLALVRIAASPPALPLASASALRAGSLVAAVGHPDGSRWTLATGHVAQHPADGPDRALLRLQLPLRAGSSGGPVVDRLGRVVGIVALGEGRTGATFAVRSEVAARALAGLSGTSVAEGDARARRLARRGAVTRAPTAAAPR